MLDLEDYRRQADRFLASLNEEEWRHFAGHKATLELEPIYGRFEGLFELDACRELVEAAGQKDAPREARELARFACEGYLGRAAREQTERVAASEATLAAELDGGRVPYRMLHPALANEPDQGRRDRLEEARRGLVEELNDQLLEALELVHAAAGELGAAGYRELYERFGFPLAELGEACERFLAETEELHRASFDRLARSRLGLALGEVRRGDLPRLLRAAPWDDGFPAAAMVAALERTLADLGIELRAQRNVELDLEPRATKSPRAFCSPIEVPQRVVLVINPIGGLDDWLALFHEAGHAEHFAHTSPRLPLEARRLGDNAVTETWAFLLERLVTTPAWLTRRLDLGRPEELARESAATLLFFVRRYCAKLLYELELHGGGDLRALPERYAELLSAATGVEYGEVDFLDDVDPGFYVTSYLRAWALEAQVAEALASDFGRAWFAERKAGTLLRELWSEGQGLAADEIARELTGGGLELAAVGDRVRALLA